MRTRLLFLLSILLFGGLLMVSGQAGGGDIALTVYNDGAALIREQRKMNLEQGLNQITIRDVAATIDPTSFSFKSMSGPAGAIVLEQSFRYDKGNAAALLAGAIGETVELSLSADERYSGELLRLHGEKAILQTGAREIQFVNLHDISGIKLPAPPADLYAGPTLKLLLNSVSAGEQAIELTYLAGGINWSADYNIYLADDESALDLRGLITLRNRSGHAYREASLKLIAGDVDRIEPEADYAEERLMAAMSAAADESGDVEQRDLGEFKLYAIARPISIEDEETKQIEFVRGADIAAMVTYVFDSSPAFHGYYRPIDYLEGRGMHVAQVRTHLEFNTGGASGLGADLPAGRARVYKADVDGAVALIGENIIGHSPEGEDLSLRLGAAFDLTGERTQTDFSFVSRLVARESFAISLRNRKKDEAVEILVPERLYRWRDWQIIESSAPFMKADAASIEFAITVPPGAEEVLTYTVEYKFPEDN